jgi:hypothetical protein
MKGHILHCPALTEVASRNIGRIPKHQLWSNLQPTPVRRTDHGETN